MSANSLFPRADRERGLLFPSKKQINRTTPYTTKTSVPIGMLLDVDRDGFPDSFLGFGL